MDEHHDPQTISQYPSWVADAVRQAPVGVFVADPAGQCLFVNQRWAELTALEPAAALGRSWLETVHPDDRTRLSARWYAGQPHGALEDEFRLQRPDGSVRWMHGFAIPVHHADGRLVGQVGVIADITEQREVERAYRTLVEHSLQGILVVQDGRPVFANPALVELSGYDGADILAQPRPQGLAMIDPSDCTRVVEHVAHFIGGQPVAARLDMRMVHHDGSVRSLEMFMSHLEYHGRPAVQIAFVDVTERRRAHDAAQHLNAELERRVRERTTQLEAAVREIESFSYSVSHDLRAPLRAIDGFSQALIEDYGGRLDAQGIEYLARVRRAARHMGELIDDLLGLSRVMRSEFVREPVDLSALAEEVVDELRRAEPQRRVEVTIAAGLQASGDRVLVRTVLVNLLGNAWKFTGRCADAHIAVGTSGAAQPPVFFVRDDGVGFDMGHADKLFGAFERLHGRDEFEGTGIGLATVQRIVARHGGRVWAEAAPDQGATFYFTLSA